MSMRAGLVGVACLAVGLLGAIRALVHTCVRRSQVGPWVLQVSVNVTRAPLWASCAIGPCTGIPSKHAAGAHASVLAVPGWDTCGIGRVMYCSGNDTSHS